MSRLSALEIDLDVICEHCHLMLPYKVNGTVITVSMCEKCLKESCCEARDNGYDEGREDVTGNIGYMAELVADSLKMAQKLDPNRSSR